jgi:hypothetical protein
VPEEHAKIEPNSIHQETPHAPPKKQNHCSQKTNLKTGRHKSIQ